LSYLPLILDIAILLVLILCAWRGAVKGFILSLCGLLAVIVAFVGAMWVSNQFSEPAGKFIEPYISGYVEQVLDNSLDQLGFDSIPDAAPDATLSPQIPTDGALEIPIDPQAILNEVLAALKESKLFSGLLERVSEALKADTVTSIDTAVKTASKIISYHIARAALFLLSFILILVLWWLISHALDLAFKLPVLRTFNKAGGFLFGLIKGALILLVACWAIRFFDVIPDETAQQTKLFLYFLNFQLF